MFNLKLDLSHMTHKITILTIWKMENTKEIKMKNVDYDMGKVVVNGVMALIIMARGKMVRGMDKAP